MTARPRSSRSGNASTATAYDHGFTTDESMPAWVTDRSDSFREAWEEGRADRQLAQSDAPPRDEPPAPKPKTPKQRAASTDDDDDDEDDDDSGGSGSSSVRRRAAQLRAGTFAGLGAVPTIRGTVAGAALGMFFYCLGVNWLRGGRAQARGWMAAKFLNKPYAGLPPAAAQLFVSPTQPGQAPRMNGQPVPATTTPPGSLGFVWAQPAPTPGPTP